MTQLRKIDKGRLKLAHERLEEARTWLNMAQERLQSLQELGQVPPLYAETAPDLVKILLELKGAKDYLDRTAVEILQITVPVDLGAGSGSTIVEAELHDGPPPPLGGMTGTQAESAEVSDE